MMKGDGEAGLINGGASQSRIDDQMRSQQLHGIQFTFSLCTACTRPGGVCKGRCDTPNCDYFFIMKMMEMVL